MTDWIEELLSSVADDENEEQKDEDVTETAAPGGGTARRTVIPAEEPEGQIPGERQSGGTHQWEQTRETAEEESGIPPEARRPEREETHLPEARRPEREETLLPEARQPVRKETLLPEVEKAVSGEAILPPIAGEAEPLQLPEAGAGDSESGLTELYHQVARAAETAWDAASAAQSGADRVLPEPVPAEPIRVTMEELDRAMRRDSRRYDGGMTIY